MNRFALLMLFTLANYADVQAQDSANSAPPVRVHGDLDETLGRQVVVEGLAWGYMSKGLSDWVVTGHGQRVYVKGVDFAKLNGRLVRLHGTLRKKRMEPAPPGAQGYGRAFDYYELQTTQAELIAQVTEGSVTSKKPVAPQPRVDGGKQANPIP